MATWIWSSLYVKDCMCMFAVAVKCYCCCSEVLLAIVVNVIAVAVKCYCCGERVIGYCGECGRGGIVCGTSLNSQEYILGII